MNDLRVLSSEGRRYSHRVSTNTPIVLDVLHLRMRCHLENISVSGAKCVVSKAAPLMIGSKTTLFFMLPNENRFFILNARVVYISPSSFELDKNEVGVKFVDMKPDVHQQMEAWISKISIC